MTNKTILKSFVAFCLLCCTAKSAVIPLLYDTTSKKIVAPSNILGFTFGGDILTNLVGTGLTNDNGILKVVGGGGSGTVTSVGLSLPAIFSVSGTPVTSSGTLNGALATQSANRAFLGPTSGGAAIPTFRAIVDDDVPNTITIDLAAVATVANSGDSATAFFSSGTIEDARIDSVIARDSEVAAAYQPLDADLTTLATLNGASLTNLNGVDDPYDATAWNGSTKIPTQNVIRDKIESLSLGGGGDVYLSSNNVFTASNNFQGMVTLGSLSRSNFLPSATEFYFTTEFLTGTSGTTTTVFLPFQGNAINSGTAAAAQGTTNHPGIITLASATSANSGYAYTCNSSALIPRPGDFFRISFKPLNTNAGVREYLGFHDQGGAASAPTDGLCIFRSNNIIYGQAWNNSVLVQTLNSASLASNSWYSAWGHVVDDTVAQFIITDETGASVLTDTITNGVPFTRAFGAGIVSYYTNTPGGSVNLGQYDNVHVGNIRNIQR